ncbi:hypothetical protein BWI17_15305 [Betaproteobacteria bacterium GR16-43]|nr:hypothetical protein BWI17_15305 [Betaproteobacteria bacterium GR16-43]
MLRSTAELRAVEERFGNVTPPLMERAGQAAADLASTLAPEDATIFVAAGPGNNGGDAWVVAARLAAASRRAVVFDVLGTPPRAPEAVAAKASFIAQGGVVLREWTTHLRPALVVDGLLGIGGSRPPEGALAATIERINTCGASVLALDLPSGIDADTGRRLGLAVRADDTITFLALKPGLYTGEGLVLRGRVHLASLGLAPADFGLPRGTLLAWNDVRDGLPPRETNAHKGTHGTLGIVGGAPGMTGAAILAARAGLHAGAGKVIVALLDEDAPAYDPGAPELMLRELKDAIEADVIVAGPGAGNSAGIAMALPLSKPLVLDADALNEVAHSDALRRVLLARAAPTILTPHPGEAARLLSTDTKSIQADRVGCALRLASTFKAHVVLKGAGSVVAHPDGTYAINTTGNPGLASGGTGDALAGMIGAMLCQGLAAARALEFAVCLHGAAADACVARGVGPVGLTASDVILSARALLNSKD